MSSIAYTRTAYDFIASYNVTAPSSGSAYAQVYSLLSAQQQAEIANYRVMRMDIANGGTAINYEHATPGNPSVISPYSAPTQVLANQKPNETLPMVNAHLNTYIRSSGAAATVAVVLFCVTGDNI